MTLNIAISGVLGRMGRILVADVLAAKDLALADLLEFSGHPDMGSDAGQALGLPALTGRTVADTLTGKPDVLVDFSTPDGFLARLEGCAEAGVPCVSGTTGLSPAQDKRLDALAQAVPVLHSHNMSVGANLLMGLAESATRALAGDVDVEIVEAHHGRKEDAPSGTALSLLEAVQRALGNPGPAVHGRQGRPGPRPPGEIGVHALRGGTVTGEHTVYLLLKNERIELTHRAEERSIFTKGALWAARKIAALPAGRYTMKDLLE
jgi:4-hydroxy-tetrahydrodipicolinate reductase